jgi:hypothetical protein
MFKYHISNNKNLLFYLIISFLILILIYNNNLAKKTYKIISIDFNDRINNIYGFCGNESVGYLKYIKKNYNIKNNLKIYDYTVHASSAWAINNPQNKFIDNKFILLNYPEIYDIKFYNDNKGLWHKNRDIQYSKGINYIYFDLNKTNIKINGSIEIIKKSLNKEKIIHSFKINQIINNKQKIYENYLSNDLNSRWDPVYLRVKLMDKRNFKYISSISVNLKNILDINKFKIINKFENCYYVSK